MINRLLPAMSAAVLVGMPAIAAAQSCTGNHTGNAVRLEMEATGLRSAKGEVAFTIYANDPKKFLAKGAKLLRVRVPAVAPATRACFWLPAGQYEAVVYHDENADHDFNRTLFLPKEGYAISNDAPTTFGLPKFKDARFPLPAGGTTMRMKMRYP